MYSVVDSVRHISRAMGSVPTGLCSMAVSSKCLINTGLLAVTIMLSRRSRGKSVNESELNELGKLAAIDMLLAIDLMCNYLRSPSTVTSLESAIKEVREHAEIRNTDWPPAGIPGPDVR